MIVLTLFTSVALMCFMRNDVTVGQRTCPLSSPYLIRMCQPVTVTNKNHFYIDFSYFEHTTEDSCMCSFTAPTRGNFKMTATTFTPISNCGTKVEVSIHRVVIPDGVVQCKPDRFLPATAYTGEEVVVTIRSTSSSVKLAPYFYIATFPVNVTFTCYGSVSFNFPNIKVKSTAITTYKRTRRPKKVSSSSLVHKLFTEQTTFKMSTSAKSIGNESLEEKKCTTEVTEYFYIAGLALQSVIIFTLLCIIVCIRRRRHEGINGRQEQMYEQCARSTDYSNIQTYDTIKGSDNCPPDSLYLVKMCHSVTVYGNRFTIEFSDFELTDIHTCRCSFIAPSRGNFDMAPTSFLSVNNCGTRINILINEVSTPGGTVACRPDPFLSADAYPGDNVSVIISITSTSTRIAPYCYVATFPVNVTFKCNGPLQPITASTSVEPTTSTNPADITIPMSAPSSSRETVATSTGVTDKPSSFQTTITTKAESIPMINECQYAEENMSQTNVTGYKVGLALLSVIICFLLGIIAFLIWKKHNERKNDKRAQIYEQCTSSRNIENMQTYDELRPQPASNIYLNTALDKE